jgi:transcriptional regulator with XRE-family HTH domain
MIDLAITERIKQIRRETGLSQEKFAITLGVSPGNVSSWESKNVLPGAIALKSMHEKLGYSVDWILTGKGLQDSPEQIKSKTIPDQDLEKMIAVLRRLMENDNPDIRGWAKVQFKKTFKEHY